MDLTQFRAGASIVIDASPEVLYDFIADMPRAGEISPVCTGGEWETDARGVGATFMGRNTTPERTWQARMRVVVADRPRTFAWCNLGSHVIPLADDLPHNVQWTYVFTPVGSGTRVDETWQVLESSGQRYYDMVETCEYSVDPRSVERRNEAQLQAMADGTQTSIEETLVTMKEHFER